MKLLRETGSYAGLFLLVTACNGGERPRSTEPARASVVSSAALAPSAVAASAGLAPSAAPTATPNRVTAAVAAPRVAAPRAAVESLRVKRFVIASGVQEREPLPMAEPPRPNGARIYAFAELANAEGPSENVRITFERKGGKERVGDVTLPVPGNAPRHRTWAFTRNIFAPGTWEAVLWSERGVELSRASFDVKAS